MFLLEMPFLMFLAISETLEVSRNLPGAHGSVLAKYEPVAIHGGPIRVQYYVPDSPDLVLVLPFPQGLYFPQK